MRHPLLLPSPEFPLIRNEAVELVGGPLPVGWFPFFLSLSTFPYRQTERKCGTAAAEEARKMEPDSQPKKHGRRGRATTEPPKRGDLGAKAWCTKRAHETQEGLKAASLA